MKFDHAKTGFALVGRHAALPCASCHVQPATKVRLKSARCTDCHQDPHKGVFKGQDCSACHKESGFKGGTFDHAVKARFPLDGKHVGLACAACHKGAAPVAGVAPAKRSVDFRGARPECSSCHADVHKGQLGARCETCHTAAAFRVARYQHPRFPEFFAGAHAAVACEKCHAADLSAGTVAGTGGRPVPVRKFKGVPLDCASCHKDPHLGQVSPNCGSCHGVDVAKFAVARFDHSKARFALTGKHAALDCAKCHRKESGTFPDGSGTAVRLKGLPIDCAGCHKDVHLGQLGSACETCHTAETFALKGYKHRNAALSGFFTDKHATSECKACHRKDEAAYPSGRGTAVRFTGLKASDCARCHDDAHRGALGTECGSCHGMSAWRTASRAFHKSGNFPLEGKHLSVPCASCHTGGVFKGTPTRCFDCHWIRRQDDLYRTLLGSDCETCHRPVSWKAVLWNHAAQTGFALSAAHQRLACDQCHKNRVFKGTPADCYSCHRADYDRTRNPDHRAGGFPITCENCHRPGDPTWRQATFSHATFPLAGLHVTQACATCHKGNVYKGTPRDCATCHQTDFQTSKNPNHAAAAFASACDSCHKFTDTSWRQAKYSHTVWPLVGAHGAQTCTTCHKTTVYKGLPSLCLSCHQNDYQTSKNPPHVAAGIPTTCESCHKVSDPTWKGATFAHTTFPLAGLHATQACTTCHKGNLYKGTPRDCAGCHQAEYQNSKNPSHVTAGFPTTCDTCHKFSDTTWQQGSFPSHSAVFPLAGAHLTTACANCHKNNNYTTVPKSPCSACHLADYQTAITPLNHVAAGIPTTCDSCHRFADTTWSQATFAHPTFALAGVHSTTPCASCHKNGVYKGTPRDCYTCHLTDFQSATSPVPHTGFPTACDSCHRYTDSTWAQKSAFAHNTYFGLAGAHITTPCANCHKNGNYLTVPTSPCYACHQADYQGAVSPVNHITAAFPTTCDTCHKYSDTRWSQAVFSHTIFPLAGVHATTPCATCHKNGVYRGTPRDCYTCHLTDFQGAVSPVPHTGFPTACDACHRYTDSTWAQKSAFNHSSYFPLAGTHATTPCANCHKNGNYLTVPTSPCYACHQTDFQGAVSPVPHTGFSTTCDTCHAFADLTWSQRSTFRHGNYFPLAGAHATTACANCHKNGNYLTVPTSPCYACHQADYQGAISPINHIAAGFPTTCDTCHKFSDTLWSQGVFNHSWFPRNHGNSGGVCSACHTNPSNYAIFSCTICHTAAQTNSHHQGVTGYVYSSPACYACHPTGGGGDRPRTLRLR